MKPFLAGTVGILALAAGCASPLGGRDLELGAGLSAIPGAGASVSFSQRMHSGPSGRIDAIVDLTHQRVDRAVGAHGRVGNGFDQVRAGLRWRSTPDEPETWALRGGIAWLRAEGDPLLLSEPGDYGGGFLGIGYEWSLSPHLVCGPELTLQYFISEGNGDAGLVPELAWHVLWKL
ncbi:MAG TPA: hypothetical protein ENJ09_03185 [Planctomycetes bacterium]|nr:hypothetical protein [Planctomycetota bacterium]